MRTAETAEEAMKIMRESPHMILFLDLNLPGMSGIELGKRVRQDWPDGREAKPSPGVYSYPSDSSRSFSRARVDSSSLR